MTNYLYKNDLPENIKFGAEIAIDTEAMGLNNQRDRLCAVQLSDNGKDCHIIHFPTKNYQATNLKKLLKDNSKLKILHFARFDMAIIRNFLQVKIENVYCTKIASKIARTYSDSHGLKTLVRELVGIDISKKQQSSDWGANELTKNQISYASCDVLYLHEIKNKLDNILKREERYEIFINTLTFLNKRVDLDLAGWSDIDIFAH